MLDQLSDTGQVQTLLDADVWQLMEREQVALLALGEARLRGLPGNAARAELRHVRDEIEAATAAARVLSSLAPAPGAVS